MRLAKSNLIRFVGGYLKLEEDGCLIYGKIKEITITEKNILWVSFEWLLNGKGFPEVTDVWEKINPLDYVTGLKNFSLRKLGTKSRKRKRFGIYSDTKDQLVIFFLPNDRIVNLTKVIGFSYK